MMNAMILMGWATRITARLGLLYKRQAAAGHTLLPVVNPFGADDPNAYRNALDCVDQAARTMAFAMQLLPEHEFDLTPGCFPSFVKEPAHALLWAMRRLQKKVQIALRISPGSSCLFVMVPSDADCTDIHAVLCRYNLLATSADVEYPSELLPSNWILLKQHDGPVADGVAATNAMRHSLPMVNAEEPVCPIFNMSAESVSALTPDQVDALANDCRRWEHEFLASIGSSVDFAHARWIAEGRVMS